MNYAPDKLARIMRQATNFYRQELSCPKLSWKVGPNEMKPSSMGSPNPKKNDNVYMKIKSGLWVATLSMI